MSVERERLPERRPSAVVSFSHKMGDNEFVFDVGAGFDPHVGAIREMFLTGAKVGSDTEAVLNDSAVLVSLLLQRGASLKEIGKSLSRAGTFREDPDLAMRASVIGAAVDQLAVLEAEMVKG